MIATPGLSHDLDRLGAIAPFLDPVEGLRRVVAAVPRLHESSTRVVAFFPRRFEVSERGVSLQADLRLTGEEGSETRVVHVGGAALGPAPEGAVSLGGRREAWYRLVGEDRETGAVVRLSPADPALPQLAEVLGGGFADEVASRCGRRRGGRPRFEILAHRFGRRIALRVSNGGEEGVLVKVYSSGWDAALSVVLERLGGVPTGPIALPRVLLRSARLHAVALSWVPGVSVYADWTRDRGEVSGAVGRVVRRCQTRPVHELARYDALNEIGTIRKFASRVGRLAPALAEAIEERTRECVAEAESRRDDRLVLAHRDLHDKQILRAPSGLGVIDWDLGAAAPAGLDPGNYLAHLLLRSLQGRLPTRRLVAERRAFLHGFGADRRRAPRDEIRFWERLTLLRLAGVYALRPGGTALAEGLLLRAAREGERT